MLDALEQALHDRRPAKGGGLIHHSDRGSQYVAIKYTERLTEAGVEPSVNSAGDSHDNALAETINGLYKTELIRRRGPWRTLEAVEFATLEWLDWFNHRRLLEPIGNIPPADAEARYYAQAEDVARATCLNPNGLRQTPRGSITIGEMSVENHADRRIRIRFARPDQGQGRAEERQGAKSRAGQRLKGA